MEAAIAGTEASTGATPERAERGRQGAKGERTRARIKAAFADLLRAKGFAQVTIADICRSADITVGGFYFHFASQEALLDEAMAEYAADLMADLEAALAGEGFAERVTGAFLAAYADRTGLARTFQQLTRMRADYAERWREASGPWMQSLASRLRQARPDLAEPQALFLAYALTAMITTRLDIVFVYRGRAGVRDELAGELREVWRRMAAEPST